MTEPVFDVTDATFERDVMERSMQLAVVVDLWAEWCGPCRTLGPIVEKAVAATEGRAVLAKVDIDHNPRVAATFSVQSIPAVYVIRERRVVDSFVGALPEPQVVALLARAVPPQTEADRLVVAGDEASLRQALELQSDHSGAIVALAEILVERGEGDEALVLLARVPETPESRRIAARARVGSLAADGAADVEGHLEDLLEQVKGDDDARREFLDLLELWGPDDPRTLRYRKALTARLYS